MAQQVKNLPAMQDTWVQSLGWEGSLEKGTAIHFSILAWRIPRTTSDMTGRLSHSLSLFFHERFEVLGYSSEKENQSPLAT